MTITSAKNPRIKWVRALLTSSRARRDEGVFVVEGLRLLEEALASGWRARLLLHTPELNARGQALLAGFAAQGAPIEAVPEHVLRAASDTETPQGMLAVLDWQPLPLPAKLDFVFIPDAVRDPGNLGAMLRTAAAAGVQAVLLPPGAVDWLSPKVVRAGMGAHFHLPIQALSWEEIAQRLHGLSIYLADSAQGQAHTQADWRAPLALIVGGEAEGAGPEAQRLATSRVHIPMPGKAESLNAAIAAAILLFEVARQRGA